MSTLNVENIKHIAADSDSLRLATDGTVTFTKNVTAVTVDSATITNLSGTNLTGTNVTADSATITALSSTNMTASGDITGSSFNGGQLGGRRNLIINGAMQVSQRYGTSRTFTLANTATDYSLDRWQPGQFQRGGHQQVSVTDSSVPTTKAARVTSSSTSEAGSGTRMAFGQIVEHANCDFVAGKTVTLSLWIRFSNDTITGTSNGFSIELSEYDTVDPDFGITGATRTNPIYISNGSYPITWTKYTKTITCASTVKNIGARFVFADLFNTTNNEDEWYEVTAVQLEVGDTATPFEHRSYSEELALCQRYYQKHRSSTAATPMFTGLAVNTSTLRAPVTPHLGLMRDIPAITLPGSQVARGNGTSINITSVAYGNVTTYGYLFNFYTDTTFATNHVYYFVGLAGGGAALELDAEL